MFQIRPGMANGTSSRQKRCQPENRKLRLASSRSNRNRSQRLKKAEGHIPSLRGEDREDGRQFRPKHIARKQRDEKNDGKGEITKHRHGLQDIKQRDQYHFGPVILGRERRVSERKYQGGNECRQHAQRRSKRVGRQSQGRKRDFGLLSGNQRLNHLPGARSD